MSTVNQAKWEKGDPKKRASKNCNFELDLTRDTFIFFSRH